jgi:hypothetical protein
MKIRRLIAMLGMTASMLTSMVGMSAQPANAAVAQGPMAQFCRVTFPVIAGYSRITNQLITENSFRCERRILGIVNGVGVTVLATHSQTTTWYGSLQYKSTCIVSYNTSFGMNQTKDEDTYRCSAANIVQGVQFVASAGYP